MPAASVDLGLDDELDAAVRDQWAALADAGLTSLADHRGETNAPHLTLAQRAALPPPGDVRPAGAMLPVGITLAGVLLLPTRRGHVLARAVTPTTALLGLQAAVAGLLDELVGEPEPPAVHTTPGAWTPHVTLAAGLDDEQVARALAVLPLGALTGSGVELRHWVPATRTLTTLA